MKKPMLIMLAGVMLLFGSIFAYQVFQKIMQKRFLSARADKIISVSSVKATTKAWQPYISATGSLRATLGVDVTTELAGMVQEIYFKPGDKVERGTPLLKLNDSTEVAQLRSYQAEAKLARITYERDKAQYDIQAVSQATLDTDIANFKSQVAQVEQQKSVVAKKNIHAPFSGKLGICLVYPGQYVNPGDKIVTLQQLDPIYVDFYLPQQELVRIKTGQNIKLTTDAYPNTIFTGTISTIDPKVESSTRNVRVEATIHNPDEKLYPGMFGQVELDTGKVDYYVTLPQNAISFNSFGEIVYLVIKNEQSTDGTPQYVAKQTFVDVGEIRKNEIAVLSGVKAGDEVVTSGQLKLKNGSRISVNNDLFPSEKILNSGENELSERIDNEEESDGELE